MNALGFIWDFILVLVFFNWIYKPLWLVFDDICYWIFLGVNLSCDSDSLICLFNVFGIFLHIRIHIDFLGTF